MDKITSESFHILVVDDDERIRSLLRKFLIQNGYWTSTATDAQHANELLNNFKFDLIVLDIMMPGDDGVKFTADLRRDDNTPVLLLTAKGDSPDRIKGLEADLLILRQRVLFLESELEGMSSVYHVAKAVHEMQNDLKAIHPELHFNNLVYAPDKVGN